jgi:endonuclease/exonuclease/phosphatase family metal-dependent hydrolase
MTWNVENLFRPKPTAPAEELQRYNDKLALLASVIKGQDLDVMALQEIGGDDPLEELQQSLGGAFPHRESSVLPDRRGIRVAFLSKHSVYDREDIAKFPPGPALDIHDINAAGGSVPVTRMGRGALRVRIAKDGVAIDLIAVHLKSKLLSFPRPGGSSFTPRDEEERTQVAGIALMKRMAEAVTVRARANTVLQNNSQAPLLVLGDFNDVPDAQTSLILCGPAGSVIGTQGFARPDKGDDVRLFNIAPAIAEDRRYSRKHHGRPELLDQIFASEEFFPIGPDNRRRLPVVDSLVDFNTQLPSVGDNPLIRATEVAPDHAPVRATFDF